MHVYPRMSVSQSELSAKVSAHADADDKRNNIHYPSLLVVTPRDSSKPSNLHQ